MRSLRTRLAVAACTGALGLVIAGCSSGSSGIVNIDNAGKSSGIRGTALQEPLAKPAIDLTDTAGKPYDFQKATAGKLVLIYFGYTHCPDVCPTTMADLASAMSQLSPATKAKVSVVFVTTDPVRDTPAVIRKWLDQFDPSFVGLTGTSDQINADAEKLGILIDTPFKEANGTYTVDHGAQVTAFNPDGYARDIYLPGLTVADYVHDIPLLLANKS